ncbi:tetratricopeptide repeat protein, partial [bacterium]|nr:tetratricopeptide repeat protein [bacterium]
GAPAARRRRGLPRPAGGGGGGPAGVWPAAGGGLRCGLMEGFVLDRALDGDRGQLQLQLAGQRGPCSSDLWRALARLSLVREWAAVARERFDAARGRRDHETAAYYGQKLVDTPALAVEERLPVAEQLVGLYAFLNRSARAVNVLKALDGHLQWRHYEAWARSYIFPIYVRDCDEIAAAIAAGAKHIPAQDAAALNRLAIWNGLIAALRGEVDAGKAAIRAAIEAAGEIPGAGTSLAYGHYFLSVIELGDGNGAEASRHCFALLERITPETDPLLYLQANKQLGGLYLKRGECDKAQQAYLDCIGALKNVVPEGALVSVDIGLACLFMRLGDYRSAMDHLLKAWRNSHDATDETDRALILTNMAIIHAGNGQYHLALEMYGEAARTLLELDNTTGYLQTLCNMSAAENALGKGKKALRLLEKGLALARDAGDGSLEAMVLKNLGFFHYDHDEYRKSLDYLRQSVDRYQRVGQEINRYIIETGLLDALFLDDREAAGYWTSLMDTYPPITAFDRIGLKYIDGMGQIRDGAASKGLRAAFEAGKEMKAAGDSSGAAFIWMRSGEMALRQDQPSVLPGVIQSLSQAAHEFEQLGERASLDKTRRLLVAAETALAKSPNVYLSYPMLNGLYELCSTISAQLDPAAVAGKALGLVTELLGVERGGIFLKQPNGSLVLAAQVDLDTQTRRDAYEYSLHSLERVMEGGDLIFTNDTELDAVFRSRQSIQSNRIRSLLCAPIVFREGALGAIYLDSRLRTNLFDAAQRKFLKAMVDILGAVLDGSQLLRRLDEENRDLRLRTSPALSGIIGESAGMVTLTNQVQTVAPVDISVLITGETGTGKELVARSIHDLSPRRGRAFVAIDCGALPENLLEAELFGYAKGAFTDAKADKAGLFETAEGGTIFLDEIDSASKAVQARLLRVIETGRLRRVGETRERQVSVRLICATNADLDAEIGSGAFRKDLYYRIKEVRLHLPPLRERKKDIIILAEYFKRRFMVQFSRKRLRFSTEARQALLEYPWPGNVRELEHVVKSAVLLAPGTDIAAGDLELPGGQQRNPAGGKAQREEREKREIIEALQVTRGNVKRAAEMLGISRSQLYREMRKYRIDPDKTV